MFYGFTEVSKISLEAGSLCAPEAGSVWAWSNQLASAPSRAARVGSDQHVASWRTLDRLGPAQLGPARLGPPLSNAPKTDLHELSFPSALVVNDYAQERTVCQKVRR